MQIYAEVTGEGPVVVLTHGFAASSHMFATTVPALATDHTVIVWDMPGHGRSEASADASEYSTARSSTRCCASSTTSEEDRAVWLGHSLGGYLSLELVLAHPERARGLVLVDTGPGYRNDQARDGWNRMADPLRRGPRDQGPGRRARRRGAVVERPLVGDRAGDRRPPGPHPAGQPRHRRAAVDRGADAGRRRRPGRAVPEGLALHGREDPERNDRGDPGRRPRPARQPQRRVQHRAAHLPRRGLASES